MRHGILSNTYAPMVRPLNGIFEQLKSAGKVCAMYYGWEPIRDISRPGSLTFASYIHSYSDDKTDALLTDSALSCMEKYEPDFVFLYMVETDEKGGHDHQNDFHGPPPYIPNWLNTKPMMIPAIAVAM